MILPGATLGMLGGGQLGKMFTTAAQTMGYKVVVLDPDTNSPAGVIAEQHICAAYNDEAALSQLADLCDAITTEFENIPASTLAFLEEKNHRSPII
jgi:5-(carboxyamino)imidazole ribonucleotide synthase